MTKEESTDIQKKISILLKSINKLNNSIPKFKTNDNFKITESLLHKLSQEQIALEELKIKYPEFFI